VRWTVPCALVLILAPALALAQGGLAPAPFRSLPVLARVRVEVAHDHVAVLHDIDLARGDWQSGDLNVYVAFGAPGAPLALDARLYATGEGAGDSALRSIGEPIPFDRAPRKPSSALLLLGPPLMSGVVLHVREAAFRRAVSPAGAARIRVRALLDLPAADSSLGRQLVIRLGVHGGTPLSVSAVEVVAKEPPGWLTRTEARLCGPEADSYPLAVAVQPPIAPARAPVRPRPIAPSLAVRHSGDDLCLRFWTQ
jgi:hypothetical protein